MFRRKMQHFGPNIVGPAASGKFPVVRCRGADSRARHSTNDLYQLPLKWKKLSTCHCEGALRPWQSREGTCSLYKLLLKRCAPIASVAALSERHAGQQHVAHGFCGVTPPELSLRGRFAPVAISQYLAGLWESCRRNRNCLHEIATSASGLLAMTNLGALRQKQCSACCKPPWRSPSALKNTEAAPLLRRLPTISGEIDKGQSSAWKFCPLHAAFPQRPGCPLPFGRVAHGRNK